MSTEPITTSRQRGGKAGLLALLFFVGACAAYAGMRWHAQLEQWLVPSVAPTANDPSALSEAPDTNATTSTSPTGDSRGTQQLWTCGMHPQVIQGHPGDCPICHMKLTPLTGEGGTPAAGNAGDVVIDPVVVQNMGVRLVDATDGRLAHVIRATAAVMEPETGMVDVNLRVSGWIQKLYADTDGMKVHKGEPLFDLYSPDLTLAIEELISARRASGDDGQTGDAASVTRTTRMSLAQAAETRLTALGLTSEQIAVLGAGERAPGVVTFVAPFDGHVRDKAGVYNGSAVASGQRVMRLARRDSMWIDARVYEPDIGLVHVGQNARVRVVSQPEQDLEGEVIFLHPHFDEATRTALVRVAVPNRDDALREGMFATVEINTGESEATVLLPREAIIDTGESQIVFVSVGKGRFEPRRVETGRSGERGLVQILRGVKPGEHVVASGQFLIDSESRLREAISKFLQQKATPVAAPDDTASHAKTSKQTSGVIARVDAVAAAYLPLAETLGAAQTSGKALQVDTLLSALRDLQTENTSPEVGTFVANTIDAAEAMSTQALDEQRETFKRLSASVIALMDAAPPSASVGDSLYVVNCPMADANWLQRGTTIANPYYADDMKECGTVVRSLSRPKGAR